MNELHKKSEHEWWQKGIIYQIYPRSFMDSNGDGVGDLQGIIQKLDYVKWLGVQAIWLSPIYPSPMADFGYDISNYCAIHESFGSLQDFDKLVVEAHKRDLKVMLDFVPNHTSDQHPWFIESKSSKKNPKRDWYIWRDGKNNSKNTPPNNWLSNFGGSAWKFDEGTGQYYYHAFLAEQPDLNWRNPELREAMHEALRFWLDRGVDGFRVDVIWHMIKDNEFRDNPTNPNFKQGQNPHHEFVNLYTADQPEVHDVIREMRAVLDAYPNRMMVGEIYLPVEKLMTYYGDGGMGVHLPFNFQLITLPWNADSIAQAVQQYENSLPSYGWPNWVLGNHDNSRLATRIGVSQARVAAMLLLTLRGTPTMYYGDELGMTDVHIRPEQVCDPFEKNVPGMGLGRDPERTPMQWSSEPNAGFCEREVAPWLPVSDYYQRNNVEQLSEEGPSILTLYRKLIELRSHCAALSVGSYSHVLVENDVMVFTRKSAEQANEPCYCIALNFSKEDGTVSLKRYFEGNNDRKQIILSTHLDRIDEALIPELRLRGGEGVIIEMDEPEIADIGLAVM